MLYGNKEIQNIILEKVSEFERVKEVKVVAGAMLGSIAKGIPRYHSDYDTRFLFVNKEFEELDIDEFIFRKISGEEGIVYRYFPKDEYLFYDKIPFWELSAFLNFLREPIIDNGLNVGIHNMVPITLMSPYKWDPYGILEKIRPIIIEKGNIFYEINYWVNYIGERRNRGLDIIVKKYLDSVHAALTLEWIMKKKCFAPVHIDSLLADFNRRDIIMEITRLREILWESRMESEIVEKIPILEEWIQQCLEQANERIMYHTDEKVLQESDLKKMLFVTQKALCIPTIYQITE